MLQQKIKVLIQTMVAGPNGTKLRPGSIVDLEDNSYTRLLVKSGTVSLIDPPSLDPDFLENGGYELQEGHSYEDMKKAAVKAEPPKKAAKKVRIPKKLEPVAEKPTPTQEPAESQEPVIDAPEEDFQNITDIPETEGSVPDDGSME